MNRVWMITGAGRGLGRAFAEEAVKNGDMVIATVRKVNDADPLMKNERGISLRPIITNRREIPLKQQHFYTVSLKAENYRSGF